MKEPTAWSRRSCGPEPAACCSSLPAIDLNALDDEDEDEAADDNDEQDEGDGWASDAQQFQTDLLAALGEISSTEDAAAPAWATRYGTSRQLPLRERAAEQQRVIEQARDELAAIQAEARAAESRNQLFFGTGRPLELEVKAALEALGAKVTEPAPNRDDWLAEFPGVDAVVEVKGVAKSGAEKHAAQLEKWVAGRFEKTGNSPKGILVVNAWRDVPLPERTADAFPDQMVTYSSSRGHCLITGLQLIVIREDIERDPTRAEHWRNLILNTSGRLEGADDWRAVITVADDAAQSDDSTAQ